MKRFVLSAVVLLISSLACRTGPETPVNIHDLLYPTATSDATQTPVIHTAVVTEVVQITTTPVPTFTITPTQPVRQLCVSATEAVYMRPSVGISNYPVMELENGVQVTDLGGRKRDWVFVEYKGNRGWVNEKYLADCK